MIATPTNQRSEELSELYYTAQKMERNDQKFQLIPSVVHRFRPNYPCLAGTVPLGLGDVGSGDGGGSGATIRDGHQYACGLHAITGTPIVYSFGCYRRQDYEKSVLKHRPDAVIAIYELLPDMLVPAYQRGETYLPRPSSPSHTVLEDTPSPLSRYSLLQILLYAHLFFTYPSIYLYIDTRIHYYAIGLGGYVYNATTDRDNLFYGNAGMKKQLQRQQQIARTSMQKTKSQGLGIGLGQGHGTVSASSWRISGGGTLYVPKVSTPTVPKVNDATIPSAPKISKNVPQTNDIIPKTIFSKFPKAGTNLPKTTTSTKDRDSSVVNEDRLRGRARRRALLNSSSSIPTSNRHPHVNGASVSVMNTRMNNTRRTDTKSNSTRRRAILSDKTDNIIKASTYLTSPYDIPPSIGTPTTTPTSTPIKAKVKPLKPKSPPYNATAVRANLVMKSLRQLMIRGNHTYIDILKMDIEGRLLNTLSLAHF